MPTGRKPPNKPQTKPAAKPGAKPGPRVVDAAPPAAAAAAAPAAAPAMRPHLRAVDAPQADPTSTETDQAGAFRRADLIAAVSDRAGVKRPDAKRVLDLVLQELGRALDAGDEVNVPPLGKISVKKRKPDVDGPGVLTLKIRRPRAGAKDAGGQGESPLADPDEDG